ncbi:MAG: hypothetical protein JST92_21930 [Deltaproteobacteria bacterium]|nr:hypothetical protein [Deltaproteobacteria bacterium]
MVRKLAIGVKPRLTVMTKESMVVALEAATGGKCDDECEVDTGRKVGADGLVSGELVKVGSQLKLQLKLHDTKSGQLLSAGTASGANLQELEKSLETVGDQLLREK